MMTDQQIADSLIGVLSLQSQRMVYKLGYTSFPLEENERTKLLKEHNQHHIPTWLPLYLHIKKL